MEPGQRVLDAQAVERVLRRASDLAAERDGTAPLRQPMSEEVVLAAAAEVGIAPEMVRMSLAIERLGVLPEPTGLDRISGPCEVVVQRPVDLPAVEALQRVDSLLVRQHTLRRVRTTPEGILFCRRTDTVGRIRRAVRNLTGKAPLGKAESIRASAADVDDRQSIVRLALDRHGQRAGILTGGLAVTGAGVTGTALLAAATAPVALALAPVALVAGVGVARHGRRQAENAERELSCLLDDVEFGVAPRDRARPPRPLPRARARSEQEQFHL